MKLAPKSKWTGNRQRYSWFLRPPYGAYFHRPHWWNGVSDIDDQAALYEILRRHPRVHEMLEETLGKENYDLSKFPVAIRCLRQVGLRPWTDLSEFERQRWSDSAASLKGIDRRSGADKCESLQLEALTNLVEQRAGDLWPATIKSDR